MTIVSACIGFTILTGGTSARCDATDSEVNAAGFVRTAETVFAPLYAPLAGHIVTTFDCTSWDGIGIDIGGGPGHLVIELAKQTSSMRWIDLDINPSYFTYVSRLAEEAGVADRVGFIAADVHQMPFRNGYADIVVSRGSMHMWKDRPKAFAEILRVLKPGGVAWIGRGFSPNLPVETARSIRDKQNGGPRYDKHETARELEEILSSLGVRDYKIHIPVPPGSDGVNYGVWAEFRKPGGSPMNRTPRPRPVVSATESDRPVYVFEPVEVTGRRTRDIVAEPLTESAGLELSVSVVDRAEMEKQGAKTVMDALEYIPGAWVESRGRKVKQFFSVRGQKYPYPEYAVDGALFREFHEMPYFFSSSDIERIEVLRSSASMLSGISGLTGVINIIPRRYDKPETSWEIEYGTFDTYRARLSHGAKVGNVSYSLGVDTPHTDGPKDKNAAERMSDFHGSVRWDPSPNLSIRTSLFHIDGKRELALAEPPAMKRFQEEISLFDPIRTTFGSLRTTYRSGDNASTDVIVYYANRDDIYTNVSDTGNTSTREWDFEWGANVVQSFGLSPDNILRVGAYYNRWVAPYGKRFYTGRRCDLETVSAAVVDEHTIGGLTLNAGLRVERTYIHEYGGFGIDGSAKGFGNVDPITDAWEPATVSGSIGASYILSDAVSLHGNAAAGVVRPRSGTLDTDGNEPDNERRIKLDAGVRFTGDSLGDVSVVGFLTSQNDAIALSGETQTVNNRTMELYVNRDQRQYGMELDAQSRILFRKIRLFTNATVMDPRVEMNGDMKRNKEMPSFISAAGVYGTYSRWDMNLFWKYMSSYESLRFAAGTDPVSLGDFHSLNFSIGRSFESSLRTRIYLEIKNLTDTHFSTVVGYPDYGRRYTLGIRQTL